MGRPISQTPGRAPPRLPGARAVHVRHRREALAESAVEPKGGLPALHPPRAARRRARGRALELPLAHLGERGGARAARRQQRDPQDGGADAARRRALRRGVRGRRACPRACSSSCTSTTTQVGAHHRRPAHRLRRLHRLGGGRPRGAARRGRALHRHRPRARRQGPGLRARRRDARRAVENLVDGSYFNSGQSCCGIERIYVDQKLFKDFVEGFVELDAPIPARQSARAGNHARADGAHRRRRQRARADQRGDAKGREGAAQA